ncbi:segregation/condensation protein A [Candidatus Woesearchaeota archaeon]|nr:segregation/condensation protein A [Candidatus Woesearchaeota archaeon]
MSQDRILNLLMQKDEITWQTILNDLIKSGEINPWDIDISILANKYIETVKKMQEANLFISGKVLLASAILLKIKSEKLIIEDIGILDNLMFPAPMEELDQFMDPQSRRIILDVEPRLTIKTPQARKKKVQIDDLISALERALEVNQRRLIRIAERNRVPTDLIIPKKRIDIEKLIMEIYNKIKIVFEKKPTLTFIDLVASDKKEDKIFTFIPLLHLSNQEKIDLDQKEHFGDINIKLLGK